MRGITSPLSDVVNVILSKDLGPFVSHLLRLAKANVRPLIGGSMGEAIHLSHTERRTLIQTARRALDDAGFTDIPIIAGTGAGSTRETIELCHAAADAGADYAIVITSGYFAGALNPKALKAFFTEVAEKSPLPVVIYNCEPWSFDISFLSLTFYSTVPAASGGIDLDSDLITQLAEECPNLCGVKLTYVL